MIYNNFDQLKQVLSQEGRLMGLDVGTKTIGVAVSDASRVISNPKLTLNRKGNRQDFTSLETIIREYKIAAIVIGLPINMNESESEMSKFVRRFASNLDQYLQTMPIIFYDERLTSFAADNILTQELGTERSKIKTKIDKIAASIILQGALEEMQK